MTIVPGHLSLGTQHVRYREDFWLQTNHVLTVYWRDI